MSQKQPLVSVIVPNYNHAPFLAERLESIFLQNYRNFEVILLDDCSTDRSLQILKTYQKHPKCSTLVANQVNTGSPFIQWIRGISMAKGKYVLIAESDDVAHIELIASLSQLLEANESLVMAFTQSITIDKNGLTITEKFDFDQSFSMNGRDFVEKYLCQKNTIPTVSSVLFRRDALSKSIGAAKNFKYAGDWMFYLTILEQGNIAYLHEALNFQRIQVESTRFNVGRLSFQTRRIEYFSIYQHLSKSFHLSEDKRRAFFQKNIKVIDTALESPSLIARILKSNNTSFAIYCANNIGLLVKKLVEDEYQSEDISVSCFIDEKAASKDSQIFQAPIFTLEQFIKRNSHLPIFIASEQFYNEIFTALTHKGLDDSVINRKEI